LTRKGRQSKAGCSGGVLESPKKKGKKTAREGEVVDTIAKNVG